MSRRYLVMASVRWFNACAAYAVETAARLRERGHAVRLVVKPGSPVEAVARKRDLEIETGFDLTDTRPGRIAAHIRGLRRLVESWRPDLINAHRSEDHLLAAIASRRTGIPLVRTRGDVRAPRVNWGNRMLYGRATAAHIACADFMPSRFFTPMNLDPNRVLVIRPGLEPDFAEGAPDRAQARQSLELPPDDLILGLVGRFTAAKGHRVLLEAAGHLSNGLKHSVILSGLPNEIDEPRMRSWAREFGVEERVRFTPPQTDVRVLLRALDVLVVPSIASDAIPRIAIEGLALGIPTVASDLNGLPEVVGDAGWLVPPGDARALSRALGQVLESPDLRDRAAQAGPARIHRRYSGPIHAALTEQLFASLVDDKR